MDERAFSDEVKRLVQASLTGAPDHHRRGDGDEARVADAFLHLWRLAEENTAGQGARLARDASGLLEALFTGSRHPVWQFVEGVRKSRRGAPNHNTVHGRATVVAAAQALRDTKGCDLPSAAAARLLRASGMQVGASTIKNWADRSMPHQDLIDRIEGEIRDMAERSGVAVAIVCVERVKQVWPFTPARPVRSKGPAALS